MEFRRICDETLDGSDAPVCLGELPIGLLESARDTLVFCTDLGFQTERAHRASLNQGESFEHLAS